LPVHPYCLCLLPTHLLVSSTMTVYTSPTKKARIVHLKRSGLPDHEIASKFGIHRTTVARIHRQYAKTEDYYSIKPKQGRPRKLTPAEVRYGVRMLASTNAHDVTDLQRRYLPHVHPETIRQRLKLCGLKAYVRRKKPLLTATHKAGMGPRSRALDCRGLVSSDLLRRVQIQLDWIRWSQLVLEEAWGRV
jgi:transposase